MLPMVECQAGGWWPPGCGLLSQTQDAATNTITQMFAGVLASMASWMWSFISGAFGVSAIGSSDWTIVSGLTNWWIVVMMTPLVVAMILQVLGGLVSQQPRRIGRALIAGGIAVPVVIGAVSLMQQLTAFTDSASTAVLATLGSDPYVVFMRLFGFERASAGSAQQWNLISLSTPGTNDGPIGSVITTVVAVAIVWILSFVLMCSMIFRSFALLVLAATAPVAIMLMPWERTKSWTRRWCETVVALLIAKPLAATVLAVAVKLFANSTSFAGLASGAVGMLLACAAPLMALRLVSFAGGELAAAAQVAGGGHILTRSSGIAARQVGRQLGGKLTLANLGSRKPALVQSSPQPKLAAPVFARTQNPQQNVKYDGGQLASSGPHPMPGSENKTYGQPSSKHTGPAHRNHGASSTSAPPTSARSSNGGLDISTPADSSVPRPLGHQISGGATRGQQAPPQAQQPVLAPRRAPAPPPPPPPPALPRPNTIDPERDKDV
ncbi:type IV secretion system protein [Paenarthrobacter sp. PH39-S1]|uniref:type IV secretion system protein n=1 Tax=Paenarthrobacter sp. PH39-S1 TaxID=3046204 RepID=UPI0024BB5696|nr:type IV secretion system protein [Paenarthrobacter sp. PH39-S1]MDJ0356337.1 type IV secretion system protein [Paenarthrobacter sp. PH39-S1]